MNAVLMSGRLARDVEVRSLPSGKSVANFSLAVQHPFKQGEVHFFNAVAWNRAVESLTGLTKGTMIAVQGFLQVRKYTPKGSDQEREVIEVVADKVEVLVSKPASAARDDAPPPEGEDPFSDQ